MGLNINKEINFAKFSNNNFNKSTELNSNKFNSYKNIESNLKNQKQEILIDNRILSDKEKKKNKVSSNIKLNIYYKIKGYIIQLI